MALIRTAEIDTRMLTMVTVLIGIWIAMDLLTQGLFMTSRNLYNLAVQSSVVAIMATGMVLVIVARHIDLSVGSVMGFTGMVIAWLQVDVFPLGAAWNWPSTVLLGLMLGAMIGAWQGYWISYRAIPAFVVTLGGLLMFRGFAFLVTDGRTVAPMDATYQLLGGGIDGSIGATWSWICGLVAIAILGLLTIRQRNSRTAHGFSVKPMWMEIALFAMWVAVIIGFVMVMNSYTKPRSDIARGIPVPVLALIGVVLVMNMIARRTSFGRHVFAMGGNPQAAELTGIDVKKMTLIIFVVMGILCGIAAVITTARLNAGANSMGQLAELSVIGGTSLAGGVGSIAGAILGAVIMQSLENGMVLMGVSSAMRQVVIGLVLLIAVWFDTLYKQSR